MKKRTLATCCVTHTLPDGLSDVSYVLLPLLAQSFGLSLAQVGLIRSAHRAAMAAFQIPAGFGGVVSLLLLAGVSWQTPVVGFGVAAVLTAAAVLTLVADSRVHSPQARKAAGWGIRDRRGFAGLCLIEVLDSSTRTAFLTFIAFLLIAKGLPERWAVLSVPLVLVGGMAGKLACGLLAERLGIARMIVLTELATGSGILAALALPGVAAFVLLPLLGVVLQGTSSVLYATLGEHVEPERLPRAFGFFYTIGSVCGIVAPLGYGLLGNHYGVQASVASMGGAILLTLPLAFLLRHPTPAPASAGAAPSAGR